MCKPHPCADVACLPSADIAEKVNIGQATFGKYPENLLGSRARYIKAFKVRSICIFSRLSRYKVLPHYREYMRYAANDAPVAPVDVSCR